MFENECISECPSGYQVTDDAMCYRADEMTLPFISMIGPFMFLLTVSISNCKDKRTRPITAFIAMESAYLFFFWIYQMSFMLKDDHNSSPLIIAFALVMNLILNCIFYDFAKTRLLGGNDKLFKEYQETYRRTQKNILFWSMLTSFQLFRFQMCAMCGSQRYMARFENRMKYYKRINRYTLFQVTFVYLPILAASSYNLYYTWYGRQIFWIDIESIVMCATMGVLHVIVILRTQGEYIKQVFDVNQFGQENNAKFSSRA